MGVGGGQACCMWEPGHTFAPTLLLLITVLLTSRKSTGKIFQNALKLYLLYKNFNKFPSTHGHGLPKDGFVYKLLQMNST